MIQISNGVDIIYKIFNECDEIITDNCIENDVQRKAIAENMGLSYKQLTNILSGNVDSSFDIVVTIFIAFLSETQFPYVFDELFKMIKENEGFITSKNLFTLYELAIIVERKREFICEFLQELQKRTNLSKVIKQTVQVILSIENSFAADKELVLNMQLSSINATYIEVFGEVESLETNWEFNTFLDYCLNMRRNERVAVNYYDSGNYVRAAEIYQLLYELPSGSHHRRYLGYRLLQTHAQIRIYPPLKEKIASVFTYEDERFREFLNMYIEKEYFKIPRFPEFVKYWFTRDKEQLIENFETTKRIDELYTLKLLLSDLTESCAYVL